MNSIFLGSVFSLIVLLQTLSFQAVSMFLIVYSISFPLDEDFSHNLSILGTIMWVLLSCNLCFSSFANSWYDAYQMASVWRDLGCKKLVNKSYWVAQGERFSRACFFIFIFLFGLRACSQVWMRLNPYITKLQKDNMVPNEL